MESGLCTLPDETLLAVLQWLGPWDLNRCGLTCRRLQLVASDPSLWRPLCEARLPVAQTQGKDAAEAWYTTKDLDWWDKARTQTWQQAYAEMVRSFFGPLEERVQTLKHTERYMMAVNGKAKRAAVIGQGRLFLFPRLLDPALPMELISCRRRHAYFQCNQVDHNDDYFYCVMRFRSRPEKAPPADIPRTCLHIRSWHDGSVIQEIPGVDLVSVTSSCVAVWRQSSSMLEVLDASGGTTLWSARQAHARCVTLVADKTETHPDGLLLYEGDRLQLFELRTGRPVPLASERAPRSVVSAQFTPCHLLLIFTARIEVLWKASLGTSPEPHRATIRADSGGKSARIDMAQAIEVDVAGRPADAPRFLLFMLARDSYFVCWQLPAEPVRSFKQYAKWSVDLRRDPKFWCDGQRLVTSMDGVGHKRRVTVAPTLVVHRLRDLLACAEIPAKPNECDTSRNVTSLALLPHAGAMVALCLDQQLFPPKGLKPLRHWRLRVFTSS